MVELRHSERVSYKATYSQTPNTPYTDDFILQVEMWVKWLGCTTDPSEDKAHPFGRLSD